MDSRCVRHSPLAASPAGASAKEAILSGVSSLDASVRMTASVSSRSLVVGRGQQRTREKIFEFVKVVCANRLEW